MEEEYLGTQRHGGQEKQRKKWNKRRTREERRSMEDLVK